jgi:hypothetical protein
MLTKIFIYLFHLLIVFPYIFFLGTKLKNTKYDNHSKILIPVAIMGFGYQLFLLIDLLIVYSKI